MIDNSENISSLLSEQCQACLLGCHLSNVMVSHVPQYHKTICERLTKIRMYLTKLLTISSTNILNVLFVEFFTLKVTSSYRLCQSHIKMNLKKFAAD